MSKSFKNDININPAMQFITPEKIEDTADHTEPEEPTPNNKKAQNIIIDTSGVEKKTRRLNLLIRPSIYTGIKKAAKKRNVSTNELINLILAEFLRGE